MTNLFWKPWSTSWGHVGMAKSEWDHATHTQSHYQTSACSLLPFLCCRSTSEGGYCAPLCSSNDQSDAWEWHTYPNAGLHPLQLHAYFNFSPFHCHHKNQWNLDGGIFAWGAEWGPWGLRSAALQIELWSKLERAGGVILSVNSTPKKSLVAVLQTKLNFQKPLLKIALCRVHDNPSWA